ncbi:hypothetical protein NQZ68_007108, partial [Dissostichus eleginoides]
MHHPDNTCVHCFCGEVIFCAEAHKKLLEVHDWASPTVRFGLNFDREGIADCFIQKDRRMDFVF